MLQLLPDGSNVDVLEVVKLLLCEEAILPDELGDAALHLQPGKDGLGAGVQVDQRQPIFQPDTIKEILVFGLELVFKPFGGLAFSAVSFHVTDNGTLALDASVPGLQGGVDFLLGHFPGRTDFRLWGSIVTGGISLCWRGHRTRISVGRLRWSIL